MMLFRHYVIIRHYYGTMRTLYDIKTLRGHYEENLTQEGWGKCAPTHTRKNRAGLPLRASERHADTATDGNKPEIEPTSDFLTRAEERAENDKKTRHRRHHAATVPPRADERQERRRKDTARPPHQPKTAQSGRRHQDAERRQADTIRRQENAERATLRHHAHAPTHHERRRICTHTRAQRV